MNSVYYSFNVDVREKVGKKFNSYLKSSNKIPGVIYGNSFLQSVSIDVSVLTLLVNSINNGVNIFECNLGNDKFLVVVKEVQSHPYKREYMHVDLQRVCLSDIININVFFKFLGFESSLGVKNGGVLIKHMSSMKIKCKVLDVPESIIVDVSNLNLNESVYLSDLKISDKVSIPSFYNKSKFLVASVVGSRVVDDNKAKDKDKEKDNEKDKEKDKEKNKDKSKNNVLSKK